MHALYSGMLRPLKHQAVPFQFKWTTSPAANALLGDSARAPIVRVGAVADQRYASFHR
jgi:hypothetical protein